VTDRVIRRIQRSVEAARATHSAAHSAGMSVGFPRVTLYCDDVERLILMADSKTQDLNEKDERIRELEDEIEDVRRDAENSEEQLGYMMDLQTQVNALFDAIGIPGHESLTASDTIEYAVEHLSHEKAQRERIRELEAENKWLRAALDEIRYYTSSQPAALNVPDESWEKMRARGMEAIAWKALEDKS